MTTTPTGNAQTLSFTAADGTPLAGTLYEPQAPAGSVARAAVLVAGGLGIAQRFYAPFAHWLSQQGYRVLTFDLRGMGASRQPEHRNSLRGLDADMLTWARQDFAAAVMRLAEHGRDGRDGREGRYGRVALVGHSLGMHHAAMTTPQAQQRISTAVSVAAGSGYWRDWAPVSRSKAPLMLHLAAPLLTSLLGWFPGKRLRMVGDLPGPAMRQWSRWCRHPEFAWGAEPELVMPSLLAARFPIHAFSFTDDDAMTENCTRKLLAAMPNARSQLQVIAPRDLGLAAIGHVGAFRPEVGAVVWPLIEAKLRMAPP